MSAELETLETKAQSGDKKAQASLGDRYYAGDGVPKDLVKALAWYARAAASGHPGAQASLGHMLLKGEAVPRNELAAYTWFEKAAAAGNAQAKKMLASREKQRQGGGKLDEADRVTLMLRENPKLQRVAARIEHAAQMSLRLVSKPVKKEGDIPLGQTKMGGSPDLPLRSQWPERDGVPLSFLMQVNLAEARAELKGTDLPEDGRLYFFHDSVADPEGRGPEEASAWKIVYRSAKNTQLKRAVVPPPKTKKGKTVVYKPVALTLQKELSLPSPGSHVLRGLELGPAEIDAYGEFFEEVSKIRKLSQKPRTVHRLLGFPDFSGTDVSRKAQYGSLGKFVNLERPVPKIERGVEDWVLLCQLDGDKDAKMQFGKGERLYFMMRRAALEGGDFAAVWLVRGS